MKIEGVTNQQKYFLNIKWFFLKFGKNEGHNKKCTIYPHYKF